VGIRKKILLGFVAIGFILLLSGVVAIFEMTRLTDLISGLLTNNIKTISAANTMEQIAIKHNGRIYDITQDESYIQQAKFSQDITLLRERLDFITNNVTIEEEMTFVDKLYIEFDVYKALLDNLPAVIEMPREQRIAWYLTYQKAFTSLIETTSEITKLNQDALSDNAIKLEGNYYRMIMPAIIAIIAGVFMILFFNYFINSYLINPVIQIKDNIRSVLSSRAPYTIKVKTNDEINELNENIKDLVSQLKKREKECSSIQNENREA
jgi:HAMP domain-containing protein